MSSYRIAVIAGDGIGVDVVRAGLSVLEAAQTAIGGFSLQVAELPWSCRYYLEHGRMMPGDGMARLRQFDAIYLGAVGWPEQVPDHVSLWGLLLPIRKD